MRCTGDWISLRGVSSPFSKIQRRSGLGIGEENIVVSFGIIFQISIRII
jgi:hypothetical protein